MKKLRVTVDGRAFDVTVEVLDEQVVAPSAARLAPELPVIPLAPPATVPAAPRASAAPGQILCPIAGKVVSIAVKAGQAVAEGAVLLTLDAMKMNTFVYAPQAGTVTAVHVQPGDAVEESAALLTLK
ncbi:MAG: acetyl-CoA carboxylase biotin carboxyl carrier protein subunit [Opitutus sp.]|nr:acetyl-CoA carboxylase biotin carboxyl carrier protein subunit [Opitutus sp.]